MTHLLFLQALQRENCHGRLGCPCGFPSVGSETATGTFLKYFTLP